MFSPCFDWMYYSISGTILDEMIKMYIHFIYSFYCTISQKMLFEISRIISLDEIFAFLFFFLFFFFLKGSSARPYWYLTVCIQKKERERIYPFLMANHSLWSALLTKWRMITSSLYCGWMEWELGLLLISIIVANKTYMNNPLVYGQQRIWTVRGRE